MDTKSKLIAGFKRYREKTTKDKSDGWQFKVRVYNINNETKLLKQKIVENYSKVEGSQYKDLLVYYKKIKDNLQEMDNVKNNIHYSKLKLQNKTEKLEKSKGKNATLRNLIIVFFITGLILALLFRFL